MEREVAYAGRYARFSVTPSGRLPVALVTLSKAQRRTAMAASCRTNHGKTAVFNVRSMSYCCRTEQIGRFGDQNKLHHKLGAYRPESLVPQGFQSSAPNPQGQQV